MLTVNELIVIGWFAFSVLAEIVSSLGFLIWLRRHGVKVSIRFYGIPGYLEYYYAEWCRINGKSPYRWITIRALLLVSTIGACVFTYRVLISI
jgi:hypothetical protein